MSNDNRYPTVPPKNFQSSNPEDAAKADNGVRPWISHPAKEEQFSDYRKMQSQAPSSYQMNGSGEIVSGSAPENGRVPDNSPRRKASAAKQIDNPITDSGILYELTDSDHEIISRSDETANKGDEY